MKVRNGFVSNSSSSSFIVSFSKVPSSIQEVQMDMFGTLEDSKESYYSETTTRYHIASGFYNRLINMNGSTDVEIGNEFYNYYDGYYSQFEKQLDDYCPEDNIPFKGFNSIWDFHDYLRSERGLELAEKWINEHPGLIYVLEFSDNNGSTECVLEHSGIIEDTYNAIKISHH